MAAGEPGIPWTRGSDEGGVRPISNNKKKIEAEGQPQELFCTAGSIGTKQIGGGFETTTLPLFCSSLTWPPAISNGFQRIISIR
jgi:hypothetical protein